MMLGHPHLFPDEVKQTASTSGLVVASRPRHRRAATNSGEMITDHYVQLQGKIWMDLLEETKLESYSFKGYIKCSQGEHRTPCNICQLSNKQCFILLNLYFILKYLLQQNKQKSG